MLSLNRSNVLVAGLCGLMISLAGSGCGDDDDCCAAGTTAYDVVASEPRFVVPSAALPAAIQPFASNNNVDIQFHEDRLYMAWRSAPTHFASTQTRMFVVSSLDDGLTWDFEHDIHIGADMREPRLLSFGGELQLLFFEAGRNPTAFEPMRILRSVRRDLGDWGDLEIVRDAPVVPWDLKVRDGAAYLTTYEGERDAPGGFSDIRVTFEVSTDGDRFVPVDGRETVYRGGVSEAAFEFGRDGSLWIVTRNEDGDATGFGSHVCRAPAERLADWDCPPQSDPNRYDSPEMFRHEDDIYLIARRDVGGPFDQADPSLPFDDRKFENLIAYSNRPKRTALYRIDQEERRVVHVFDLPSAGDTAFPAVQQTGPHTFLVANYTSPLDRPDVTWLEGQTSERGTQLYLLTLTFVERGSVALPTPTATWTAAPTPTPTVAPLEARVELAPVFAVPGADLSVTWPMLDGFAGDIDFGDGTTGDETTESHAYADRVAVYDVESRVSFAGAEALQQGAVARTDLQAFAPLRRFQLTTPSDPVVQGVIRSVIPAFYWAFGDERLAVAVDPTARAAFAFDDVATTALAWSEDGSEFSSGPVDVQAPLVAPGGVAADLVVGLRAITFSGTVVGDHIGPVIALEAEIVVADVVAVLRELGGFEEQAALEFLADLFEFDPAAPPETAPFVGSFRVEPVPGAAGAE